MFPPSKRIYGRCDEEHIKDLRNDILSFHPQRGFTAVATLRIYYSRSWQFLFPPSKRIYGRCDAFYASLAGYMVYGFHPQRGFTAVATFYLVSAAGRHHPFPPSKRIYGRCDSDGLVCWLQGLLVSTLKEDLRPLRPLPHLNNSSTLVCFHPQRGFTAVATYISVD